MGEASQPYSLSGRRIAPFVGKRANLGAPDQRWRPVTPEILAELSRRSRGRVEQSEEFREIRERLNSIEKDNGVIRVADILKNGASDAGGGDGQSSEGGPGDAEEKKENSPQTQEALHILADLVALNR